MMLGRILTLASLLIVLASQQLWAQTARELPPPQCTYNGDCNEPLICSSTFCRYQCMTDRDCYNGWVCGQPNFTFSPGVIHAVADAVNYNRCVPPGTTNDVTVDPNGVHLSPIHLPACAPPTIAQPPACTPAPTAQPPTAQPPAQPPKSSSLGQAGVVPIAATPQTILVPTQAFSNGTLTGVVLGPDDQPVQNAPVEIAAGGVPGSLTGEVIGEDPNRPQPKQPQPGLTAGQSPGSTPVSCPSGTLASTPGASQLPAPASQNLVRTDALGRFALCVVPGAAKVAVSLAGPSGPSGSQEIPVFQNAQSGVPQSPLAHPPEFVQPDQKFTLSGSFPRGSFDQNGKQGNVPVAIASNANGSESISTIKVPHSLQPGAVNWTLSDATGKPVGFKSGIFKILSASIDRSKLRSNQAADFDFEILTDPQTIPNGLCVDVKVAGPILMAQQPPTQITIDASGRGKISGKIRATQVAPGSTVPFDINTNFYGCKK